MGEEILDHSLSAVGAFHHGETMNELPTIENVLAQPATIDDVITTLHDLVADLRAHPEDWENPCLDRYLSAMGAWLQAFRGKAGETPSWRLIATALERSDC